MTLWDMLMPLMLVILSNIPLLEGTFSCFLVSSAVVWNSKGQNVTAQSSTEAQYICAAEAAKEAVYLRRLIRRICEWRGVVFIYNENQGAQILAISCGFHPTPKHTGSNIK